MCYPQFIRLLMMGGLCKSASIRTPIPAHAHKCHAKRWHEKQQKTTNLLPKQTKWKQKKKKNEKIYNRTVGVDTIFCKLYSIVWLSIFRFLMGRGIKLLWDWGAEATIRTQVHGTQVPVASSQLQVSNSTPICLKLRNLFYDNAFDCSGSGALLWYVCPVLLALHNV